MAKILNLETPLDVCLRDLTDARTRLDRALRNQGDYKEELNVILAERMRPGSENPNAQARAIELNALLGDELSLAQALKSRVEELQIELQNLTHDKARLDANLLVGESMNTFHATMKAFADPVSQAQAWLARRQRWWKGWAGTYPHPGFMRACP